MQCLHGTVSVLDSAGSVCTPVISAIEVMCPLQSNVLKWIAST